MFILVMVLGIATGVLMALLRLASTPWDGNPPVIEDKSTVAPTSQSIQQVVPAELIFNQISANQSASRQLRLLCYQDQPWQLLEHQWDLAHTASHFQVAYQPLTTEQLQEESPAKSGYLLSVTVKPGLPYGPFQQKIRIKTEKSLSKPRTPQYLKYAFW